MEHETSAILTIVWATAFGISAQVLARRWRIPSIVLLLFSGILLGPSVLNIVQPESLGEGLGILVKLAVAIILFEGSLNLRLSELRQSLAEVRNLLIVGTLTTWGLVSLIARYAGGLSWQLAIVFGALMTVTGPTVIQPILRRLSIPRNIRTILESEAILIDPVGAILAVAVFDVMLGMILNYEFDLLPVLWSYFGRLLIGTMIGMTGAIILGRLMRIPRLIPHDLSNLVVLACVWTIFGIADMILSESGIMASVAMGLTLQRESVPGERQLRRFKETLTIMGISILFVLLSANLRLESVRAEGISGVLTVLLIMFVARPVSVLLATWRTVLTWREKILIAWIGPRGIVAASVASLFAITLENIRMAEGNRLMALTFMTIAITVTIQGLSAPYLARFLGLRSMEGRKAIIVGASRFGCMVAKILTDHGRPVSLVDTNMHLSECAFRHELEAINGNALEEETLEQAGAGEGETVIALTSNPAVNVLACQVAHETFGISRAYPVLTDPERGAGPELLKQTGGKLAFGRAFDVHSWEYDAGFRTNRFEWEVPQTWQNTRVSNIPFPEDILPIILLKDNSAEVVYAEQIWHSGDKVVFLGKMSAKAAVGMLDRIRPHV